jgi:hypothetical protein
MKISCLLATTCAAFIAFGATAQAGQCTAEIDQLQKRLSKSDAGMGPTGNPDVTQSGNAETGGSQQGTPITEGTSNTLQGKAASPSDVQKQNQGQPTASDATAGSKMPVNTSAAQASLARAKELDKAGKEAACQNEVNKARAAFGAQ